MEQFIREKGYSIAEFAIKIDVNRRMVYNWLNQSQLSSETIIVIQKALNVNCSMDFLGLFGKAETTKEHKHSDVPQLNQLVNKNDPLMAKYIQLLEKHNSLLNNSLQPHCEI